MVIMLKTDLSDSVFARIAGLGLLVWSGTWELRNPFFSSEIVFAESSRTITTTFFNKKQIEINKFQTIFKNIRGFLTEIAILSTMQKRWSNFRSDLTSPSPFVQDLAQWARGSVERRAPESSK